MLVHCYITLASLFVRSSKLAGSRSGESRYPPSNWKSITRGLVFQARVTIKVPKANQPLLEARTERRRPAHTPSQNTMQLASSASSTKAKRRLISHNPSHETISITAHAFPHFPLLNTVQPISVACSIGFSTRLPINTMNKQQSAPLA